MKILLSISLMFLSILVQGQKMPSDYFEEAEEYFDEEMYNKALKGFKQIVKKHPKSEYYPIALFNVGEIYYYKKKYNRAISIFKKLLEIDMNEKEDSTRCTMTESITYYKHSAIEILSEIYYKKKMFDKALHYLILSDTVNPNLRFCGLGYASNEIYKALHYADIYQKLNQPNKAIEMLLPTVFATYTNNSKVIEELKKLLADKKGLKQELDISLSNIYSKKIDREDYSYTRYYIKFLNVEIGVPDGYEDEKTKFDKGKAIAEIKQSDFYKMIEKL